MTFDNGLWVLSSVNEVKHEHSPTRYLSVTYRHNTSGMVRAVQVDIDGDCANLTVPLIVVAPGPVQP